jgi:hypothetical protein
MRKIAIIGSGQTGLLAAHALLKAGYLVTLYSDRTPEAWLEQSSPTGVAGRFDMSLAFERELGLALWDVDASRVDAAHMTLCPVPGKRLLSMVGRLDRYGVAIDVRLQSHRWMKELLARGGRIEIEKVTIEKLDQIAGEHDLTVVAAGRGDICQLFERDAQRSVYDAPQRHLAMLCFKGPAQRLDGAPELIVQFYAIPPAGEIFSMPYYHKDLGPSWAILFEAKHGGPMDRFRDVKSGEELVRTAKRVVQDLLPWDYPWFQHVQLSDRHGWLVGEITPTVRKPVGRLPSGRIVTPLGDTAMALDPVGGQGANNGNKMARNLVECIVARGDRPFDEEWMVATFEKFYRRHGEPIYTFNNLLLENITRAGAEILIAQNGSDGRADNTSGQQAIANAFANNFDDPATLTPTLLDARKAHAFISEATGKPWPVAVAAGALQIGISQAKALVARASQRLGGSLEILR